MTKSTITREQLEEWVAQFDEDGGCDATDSQLEALIRQSLAALDSEPVAWTDEQELRDVDRGGCGYLFTVNPVTPHADERRIILLYRHAQLAPASPVCTCPSGDGSLRWPCPVHPGSSPVIPDTWIPVSERMPDVGVKVLCFPAKDEPIHATFNGQLWLQDVSWSGSEEPIDNVIPVTVTHWMPLPAGPQEVR